MSQDISTERLDALIAHHQILFSIERLQTDELGKLNAEFQADQIAALLELKRRREIEAEIAKHPLVRKVEAINAEAAIKYRTAYDDYAAENPIPAAPKES